MRRVVVLFAALLVAYGSLVVLFPETSVSPGDLIRGHDALADDCFACHRPFFGADRRRCTRCHEPARIGVVDSRGQPLRRAHAAPFHDALLEPDCMRCHTDHRGFSAPIASASFEHALLEPERRGDCAGCHERSVPRDVLHAAVPRDCASCHEVEGWKPARFDHAALAAATIERCVECHAKARPADTLHREAGDRCASCHEVKGWKPARIDHALLSPGLREACASCHEARRPRDTLHRDAGSGCGGCHGTAAWKPATVSHERFFVFDRHHPSDCKSCHPSDYQHYTCYGCHEHSPARIAAEHREEGITRFEDCVRCHRSGDAEEAEHGGGRSDGGEDGGRRRGRGHDGGDDD